jgi:hypothetical protein
MSNVICVGGVSRKGMMSPQSQKLRRQSLPLNRRVGRSASALSGTFWYKMPAELLGRKDG